MRLIIILITLNISRLVCIRFSWASPELEWRGRPFAIVFSNGGTKGEDRELLNRNSFVMTREKGKNIPKYYLNNRDMSRYAESKY